VSKLSCKQNRSDTSQDEHRIPKITIFVLTQTPKTTSLRAQNKCFCHHSAISMLNTEA